MKPPRAAGLVVTACSLAACRTTAPEPKPVDGATTVVVPVVAAPDASASATPARPTKPHEFMTTPAWARLREHWKTIDNSGGPSQGSSKDPKLEEAGTLALAALDELAKHPSAAGVEPGVFEALKSVVSTRIAVLQGLEFRLMVSHRMPSGSELARARVGASLEKRIDALIELRNKGALSPEERDLALLGIVDQIHLLVVLQSLHGYAMTDPLDRAESLEDLERVLEKRRDSDAGLVDQLEKALAEVRRLIPDLNTMIVDLQR